MFKESIVEYLKLFQLSTHILQMHSMLILISQRHWCSFIALQIYWTKNYYSLYFLIKYFENSPKRRCPTTTQHSVTIHKTSTWNFATVETSNVVCRKMFQMKFVDFNKIYIIFVRWALFSTKFTKFDLSFL